MRGLMKYRDEGFDNPLLKRDGWYHAALEAFSQHFYGDVALNTILGSAGMSKSSFYFKFYDKLDMYLCMMERGAYEKVDYISQQTIQMPSDFFESLQSLAANSMMFAKHDPLFYAFWRTYLGDSEFIKSKVRDAFPDIRNDVLGPMVDSAIATGQINPQYNRQFVYDAVNLYISNMDNFVSQDMSEKQVMDKVEQVIQFLKSSLAAD